MKRKTVYRLVIDRVIKNCVAIAQRGERGRLSQLLALPMVLDDVLEHGGSVSRQKYDALRRHYMEIAEGMLNA